MLMRAERLAPGVAPRVERLEILGALRPAALPEKEREPMETRSETTRGIPEHIQCGARQRVRALQEIEKQLEHGRETDRMFGGAGRYEADTWHRYAPDVRAAGDWLEEFFRLAAINGVGEDAAAVIREMGWPADPFRLPEPSRRALEWITHQQFRP